jgi:imidazolonepropionase
MNTTLIKNIGQLITCPENGSGDELGLITEAAVFIEDGIIKFAGKAADLPSQDIPNTAKVIDAEGKPVLPGFIDPHTHFIFGGYRDDEFNWRLQGVPYSEIMGRGGGIVNTVENTRNTSFSKLEETGKERLNSMLKFGVTTVEGKTGYGLNLESEIKQLKVMKKLKKEHPIDLAITFMGAHAIPDEFENNPDKYVDLVVNKMLPAITKEGGAEFCDIFCDQGAFTIDQSRNILQEAKNLGFKIKLHADEIAAIGASELAAELSAISADHLLKVSDKGLEKMAENNVIPVLLPMTAFSLKEDYAPARKMIEMGLSVALATDFNPGSCFSESIPLLLSLSTLYMGLKPTEAIRGLTINAAAALNRENEIGSIEAGKKGDIIILNAPSYTHLTYHFGVNSVQTVIKEGEIIFNQ